MTNEVTNKLDRGSSYKLATHQKKIDYINIHKIAIIESGEIVFCIYMIGNYLVGKYEKQEKGTKLELKSKKSLMEATSYKSFVWK